MNYHTSLVIEPIIGMTEQRGARFQLGEEVYFNAFYVSETKDIPCPICKALKNVKQEGQEIACPGYNCEDGTLTYQSKTILTKVRCKIYALGISAEYGKDEEINFNVLYRLSVIDERYTEKPRKLCHTFNEDEILYPWDDGTLTVEFLPPYCGWNSTLVFSKHNYPDYHWLSYNPETGNAELSKWDFVQEEE